MERHFVFHSYGLEVVRGMGVYVYTRILTTTVLNLRESVPAYLCFINVNCGAVTVAVFAFVKRSSSCMYILYLSTHQSNLTGALVHTRTIRVIIQCPVSAKSGMYRYSQTPVTPVHIEGYNTHTLVGELGMEPGDMDPNE